MKWLSVKKYKPLPEQNPVLFMRNCKGELHVGYYEEYEGTGNYYSFLEQGLGCSGHSGSECVTHFCIPDSIEMEGE